MGGHTHPSLIQQSQNLTSLVRGSIAPIHVEGHAPRIRHPVGLKEKRGGAPLDHAHPMTLDHKFALHADQGIKHDGGTLGHHALTGGARLTVKSQRDAPLPNKRGAKGIHAANRDLSLDVAASDACHGGYRFCRGSRRYAPRFPWGALVGSALSPRYGLNPLYLHGVLKQADQRVPHVIRGLIHCGKVRRTYTPVNRGATHCRWGANLGVCGNAVDLARVLPNNHRGPIHHDHAIRHLVQRHSTIKGGNHGVPLVGSGFFPPGL